MKYFTVIAFLCVAVVVLGEADRHPIIFFPGITGSKIQEKFDIPDSVPMPHKNCPRKSDGWEDSWIEWKKMIPNSKFECFCARFRMYSNDAGDNWTNTPGVEMRVPDWGTIKSIDPLSSEFGSVIRFYGLVTEKLLKLGYEDGKTLFIAAYDWRRMETDEWRNDVRELIEKAVNITGKKAVLFTHSMGCPFSYMFLMAQTPEWRQKYIYHYIPVSPVWIGTNIIPYIMITNKMFNITVEPFASLGGVLRYLEGPFVLTPSTFIDPDTLIAKTDKYTYTARNQSLLLERVGVKNAEAIIQHIQKQLYSYNYEHPGIPVTSIWSTGFESIGPFHWAKDSQVGIDEPIPKFIEGDGCVPHDSLVYADKLWRAGPYAEITDGIALPHTNHVTAIVCDTTISYVHNVAYGD